MNCTLLIISLPGKAPSTRMRIWRALKAGGVGILRDGVYVLPSSEHALELFHSQAEAVESAGGSAYLLDAASAVLGNDGEVAALFDRQAEYGDWTEDALRLGDELRALEEPEARRKEAALRRRLEAIAEIDFFPGDAQERASATLAQLAADINQHFSPGEPQAQARVLTRESREAYRGRTWGTRQSLWVDRVASAWLIRRFIDPHADFVWLEEPRACAANVVGFDFDGAAFTHVGNRVTFEVLSYTFELDDDPAIARIGELVHYLDVGGAPIAEATGFVTLLSGAKRSAVNDDEFLAAATPLFEHLYRAYTKESDAA